MLYFLTGEIQTGKTRWLEAQLAKLEDEGVCVYGVLAPGVWKTHPAVFDEDGNCIQEQHFEKLGIDNELLPQHNKISFAKRRDLAETIYPQSASSKAQLGWAISDDALAQVNAHFDWIASLVAEAERIQSEACTKGGENGGSCSGSEKNREDTTEALAVQNDASVEACKNNGAAANSQKGLLLIDELGRLELMHNDGLTSAVSLLDKGPTPLYQDAIVIVRETLLEEAKKCFSAAWGPGKALYPHGELIL